MTSDSQSNQRRVLIASSHGLFAQGLRSLLQERQADGVQVVGVVSNLEQAMAALEKLNPDLIIVDYDDEALNRDEFLMRFVEGEKKLRVVLLSLQSAQEAIVYDRRTLAASQIDDWLEEWNYSDDVKLPVGRRLDESTPLATTDRLSTAALLGTTAGYAVGDNAAPGDEKETPVAYNRSSKVKNRRFVMNNRTRNGMHLTIASILVVISTFVVFFTLRNIRLLPMAASAQAVSIDNLFWGELAVISFLFSLIVVLLVYSIVVFRRKKGDTQDAAHIEGNTGLEIAWTVIPLMTVFVFAIWGGQSLREVTKAEPKPLVVNVIGQQWAWRFEYPLEDGSKVTSDKLYLELNRPVLLRLSSMDVIHSFWVPEFRVKQDALPGGEAFVRPLRLTPTELGDYKLRCAELCGFQHTTMESDVFVRTQVDFEAWLAQQSGESTDPIVRGEKAARNFGCLACHSLDGTRLVGPSWKGAFGETVAFEGGLPNLVADEQYLRESIMNPNAKIVKSFPAGVMPQNFSTQMSEKQVNDVIEYIKSLK